MEVAGLRGGRTILITGARGGIGGDSALALAERGHHVIATTHTEEGAAIIKARAEERSLDIEAFKLDVTLPEDRAKTAKFELDVLVNNAALGDSGSLAEIDVDRVRRTFETNVFSPLELTQLCLRGMMERDHGTVVFISSLAGRITMPFFAPYAMTKFALAGGVDALYSELKRITKNVHVTLIEPGAYHTGFNQAMSAKKYEWMDERSYFYPVIDDIKRREELYFRIVEKRSTASIVRKVVRAAEATRPRLRYVAPLSQGLGVRLARAFGK